MNIILKVEVEGSSRIARLNPTPSYAELHVAVKKLADDLGASADGATYKNEQGDDCTLCEQTLSQFLSTAKQAPSGNSVVLTCQVSSVTAPESATDDINKTVIKDAFSEPWELVEQGSEVGEKELCTMADLTDPQDQGKAVGEPMEQASVPHGPPEDAANSSAAESEKTAPAAEDSGSQMTHAAPAEQRTGIFGWLRGSPSKATADAATKAPEEAEETAKAEEAANADVAAKAAREAAEAKAAAKADEETAEAARAAEAEVKAAEAEAAAKAAAEITKAAKETAKAEEKAKADAAAKAAREAAEAEAAAQAAEQTAKAAKAAKEAAQAEAAAKAAEEAAKAAKAAREAAEAEEAVKLVQEALAEEGRRAAAARGAEAKAPAQIHAESTTSHHAVDDIEEKVDFVLFAFDENGDGHLNFEESSAVCGVLGEDLSPVVYEGLCKEQGQNPDVGLSREALVCIYRSNFWSFGAHLAAADSKLAA